MIELDKRGFELVCISLIYIYIRGTWKINYGTPIQKIHNCGTYWKTFMGQDIFKAIFGHFINTFSRNFDFLEHCIIDKKISN